MRNSVWKDLSNEESPTPSALFKIKGWYSNFKGWTIWLLIWSRKFFPLEWKLTVVSYRVFFRNEFCFDNDQLCNKLWKLFIGMNTWWIITICRFSYINDKYLHIIFRNIYWKNWNFNIIQITNCLRIHIFKIIATFLGLIIWRSLCDTKN